MVKEDNRSSGEGEEFPYWMAGTAILATVATLGFYLNRFGCKVAAHIPDANLNGFDLYEKLGQFGDYFGGVLNPILAFINLWLLIHYQRGTLTKSLEKDDIFRVIQMHRDMLTQISVRASEGNRTGSSAIHWIVQQIENEFKVGKPDTGTPLQAELLLRDAWRNKYTDTINAGTDVSTGEELIAHYFQHLFFLLELIDESSTLAATAKARLRGIAIAQMSFEEKELLFMYCEFTEFGNKKREYAHRIAILDSLKGRRFLSSDQAKFYVTPRLEEWKELKPKDA